MKLDLQTINNRKIAQQIHTSVQNLCKRKMLDLTPICFLHVHFDNGRAVTVDVGVMNSDNTVQILFFVVSSSEKEAELKKQLEGFLIQEEAYIYNIDSDTWYYYNIQVKSFIENESYSYILGETLSSLIEVEKSYHLNQIKFLKDYSSDILSRVSKDGKILDISISVEGILKYSREELIGRHIFTLVPEESRLLFRKYSENSRSEYNKAVICRLRTAKGNYLWFESRIREIEFENNNVEWSIISKNITSQILADEALAKSQERYELAMLGGKMGIWTWDIEKNILQVSSGHKALLGYSNSEISDSPQVWLMIVHSQDKKNLIRDVLQSLKSEKIEVEFEFRMVHKNGEVLWMLARGRIIRQDDISTRLVGTVTDITKRKKTSIALRESQSQLQLLSTGIEATTTGIVIADALSEDLPLIYVNPAFEKITGFKSEEVIGQNCRFLLGNDREQQGRYDIIRGLQKKSQVSTLVRNYKKNGELFYNQLDIAPVFGTDGIITHYIGIQTDVTDKLTAQKATEETKEQLQYIFDNLESVFLSVDIQNNSVIQVSRQCQEIFGFTSEDFQKNPNLWTDLIISEDKKYLNHQLALLEIGEGTTSELRILNKKKQTLWLRVEIKPTLNIDGQLVRIDAIFTNTTAQKRQAQILKEKELAEKGLAFKSQFLANMSHEIRTPLNGIIGIAEILQKEVDSHQKHQLEIIQQSSENLLNIINDILDSSKLEAGKMHLKPSVFNFRNTLIKIKNLFNATLERKGLYFRVSFSENISKYIEADETRLTQIFTNLIGNAINFTDKGGIQILVEQHQENYLKVSISDTGIGISFQNQQKLFQKFSQIDESFTREYGGTGLGLVICKELSELMGGTIGVYSKKGHGSTFWFTFKYVEALRIPVDNKITYKRNSDNIQFSANILLVEDKVSNQEVAQLILNYLGCDVTVAIDGYDALNLYETSDFQIIFMDIQMPRMDGIETTRILKEKYKNLPPVIGLSANSQGSHAQYYIDLGMDDYLSKPITLETVRTKLQKWLPKKYYINEKKEVVQSNDNTMGTFNISLLSELEKMAGNRKEISTMLQSYLLDSKKLTATINKAHKEELINELKRSVHTLKGLSATIGATQMHAVSKAMDTKFKQGYFKVEKELFELMQELKNVEKFIEKYY